VYAQYAELSNDDSILDEPSRWQVVDLATGTNSGGLTPGAGSTVAGSTFTQKDGCTFVIDDLTTTLFFDINIMSTISVTPQSCPAGNKLEPSVGKILTANLEAFKVSDQTLQVKATIVDNKMPTTLDTAVTQNLLFNIDVQPPQPDTPLTGATATPAISRLQLMAQQIANEHGKPVYLHTNGKDVLVTEPVTTK